MELRRIINILIADVYTRCNIKSFPFDCKKVLQIYQRIKYTSLRDWISIFYFLLALLCSFVYKRKHANLWLICDRADEARDNGYNSLTGLTTPTNTTVQATAKTAKDNADTYWSTIQAKTNSGWSNWSAAETKHTEVVEGYNNTFTRDTRLNKKADKTELDASNTKVRVDYTTPHTKGTADYSSIKSTLTSVNKRLNS